MSFFEELKRRNVFRVAIAYAIGAWVLLQVADLVLENIGAPAWVIQSLMLIVALGFLVAVVVAWAYEITPEGIKKESEVDRSQSIVAATGKKLDRIVILFLAIAVVVLLYRNSQQAPVEATPVGADAAAATGSEPGGEPADTRVSERSIAVLPFRDMSPEGDQAYFGEGIAEELLNALVKLDGVTVASRTSSFSLAGEGLDVPSIARRLDVAHILEGSVRTAGNRVRVTAQLIDVSDDKHLWSETYDGTLDDIFRIQDEITSKITEALKLQLGAGTLVASADQLTRNAEAYQLYLQGRHLWRQRSAASLHRAAELFKKAVELDPGFHQAWSNLAIVYSNLPDYDASQDFESAMAFSLAAADRALELDPGNSEAMLIRANYDNMHCLPLDSARRYEAVIANNPDDPTAHHWYAILLSSSGLSDKALEQIREARRIDPLISSVISIEAQIMLEKGNYEESLELYRQSQALGIYGGSRLDEGIALMAMGSIEEGARLVRESAADWDASEAEQLNLFADAMLDSSKQAAFERAVGHAVAGKPYESFRASGRLALLGSPYLFEYFSEVECPVHEFSVWAEPFRKLRGTPEFYELMERAGWVEFWREYGWPDDCASMDQELVECPR